MGGEPVRGLQRHTGGLQCRLRVEHLRQGAVVECQGHHSDVVSRRRDADQLFRRRHVAQDPDGVGTEAERDECRGRWIRAVYRVAEDLLVTIRTRLGKGHDTHLRSPQPLAQEVGEHRRFADVSGRRDDEDRSPGVAVAVGDRCRRQIGEHARVVQNRQRSRTHRGEREEQRGGPEAESAHHQRLNVEMETILCRREMSAPTETCQKLFSMIPTPAEAW